MKKRGLSVDLRHVKSDGLLAQPIFEARDAFSTYHVDLEPHFRAVLDLLGVSDGDAAPAVLTPELNSMLDAIKGIARHLVSTCARPAPVSLAVFVSSLFSRR